MKKILPILLIIAFYGGFTSCEKDVKPDPVDDRETFLEEEYENSLRDSVWYYYKLFSLWENYIPPVDVNKIDQVGYLRDNYTKYHATSEDVLTYLMSLTKSTTASAGNYDHYSFIDREGVVSGELGGGVVTDFGMYVFYLQTATSQEGNAELYIQMVDANSAADKEGLRRGDRIVSINGITSIDYLAQQNQDFVFLNTALSSPTITLKVVKAGGETLDCVLNSIGYNFDPVLDDEVLSLTDKMVGYLAFSAFNSVIDEDGNYTEMYQTFQEIFAKFENASIDELIVDLRYNGGGAVSTAEYLANKIVPVSKQGERMMTYKVNRYLEEWGWKNPGKEFAPVFFTKTNSLNLKRVYFLVTSSSASASELLINVLKPHMDVVVIGTYSWDETENRISDNTYGKPVGFFGYEIIDSRVELYVTSFQMFNSQNQGNYFEGLTPNLHVSEYSSFYDFGDPREAMLATALNHISGKVNPLSKLGTTVLSRATQRAIGKFKNDGRVQGMYKLKGDYKEKK